MIVMGIDHLCSILVLPGALSQCVSYAFSPIWPDHGGGLECGVERIQTDDYM